VQITAMGGNLSIIRHQEALVPATDFDADDSPLKLTDQERQLIDSTWNHLTTCSDGNVEEELGVRIFLRIFELDPSIMGAFPNFGGIQSYEAMRKNVMIRLHGRRFVRAVRSVVENLDALDVTAVPNLDRLGRKHQEFHGFHIEYLRTFESAMDDVFRQALGRKFDRTTRRAWRKVFKLITSTVMRGYEDKRTCPVAATTTSTTAAAATTTTTTTTAQNASTAMPNDVNGSCNASHAD